MDLKKIHKELDRLFAIRDNLYPKKDAKNSEQINCLFNKYFNLINNISLGCDFQPTNLILDNLEKFITNPVFICGYMKSGTTLLGGLLDGHPEILLLPGDSRSTTFLDEFHKKKNPNKIEFIQKYWLNRMLRPRGQAPFWHLGNSDLTYKKLMFYIEYFYNQRNYNPLLTAISSIYCSYQNPPTPSIWIEKTTRNEFRTERILKHFPTARFIHIIRNPLVNLASIKKLYLTRGKYWEEKPFNTAILLIFKYLKWLRFKGENRPFKGVRKNEFAVSFALSLYRSAICALKNQERLGKDRYYIFRYEDLIEEPESVLYQISKFLNISWNASLLEPTYNNKPLKSNSMFAEKRQTTKIYREKTDNWKSILTPYEIFVAKLILKKPMKSYNYLK